MHCSNKVSACRRELNSLDAASRELGATVAAEQCPCSQAGKIEPRQVGRGNGGESSKTNELAQQSQIEALHCVGSTEFQSVRRAAVASVFAYAASLGRRLEDVAHYIRQRGAGSNCCPPPGITRPRQVQRIAPRRTSRPNPSLKRSANGRPPSPGRWYAVHFLRPGLGVLPSSPA